MVNIESFENLKLNLAPNSTHNDFLLVIAETRAFIMICMVRKSGYLVKKR